MSCYDIAHILAFLEGWGWFIKTQAFYSLTKVQSTPDNSNLQGKSKKVRVIGSSSYRKLEENSREEGKKQFLRTAQ